MTDFRPVKLSARPIKAPLNAYRSKSACSNGCRRQASREVVGPSIIRIVSYINKRQKSVGGIANPA
jgi:hypothetical protein